MTMTVMMVMVMVGMMTLFTDVHGGLRLESTISHLPSIAYSFNLQREVIALFRLL